MTPDQQINLWNAIGTWVAGLGTISAVIVSLWLAGRNDRIDVAVWAGRRAVFGGNGSPPSDALAISVTNRGYRPVTVTNIGWSVGKGRKRRYCIQTFADPLTATTPVELQHGRYATFLITFAFAPQWQTEFKEKFLLELSQSVLKTLRLQVHTSVGKVIDVKPEKALLDFLAGSS